MLVREELHVVNDRELLDRWTKPMTMNCIFGVVEAFKWDERRRIATDQDWKPLHARPTP